MVKYRNIFSINNFKITSLAQNKIWSAVAISANYLQFLEISSTYQRAPIFQITTYFAYVAEKQSIKSCHLNSKSSHLPSFFTFCIRLCTSVWNSVRGKLLNFGTFLLTSLLITVYKPTSPQGMTGAQLPNASISLATQDFRNWCHNDNHNFKFKNLI